jgi:hypothetical protein
MDEPVIVSDTTPVSACVRDIRIDQLGFAGELERSLFLKNLRATAKQNLQDKGVERAEGDYFAALLVESERATTDPDKLLRLYERGKISRAQLVSALSVTREPCKKFLSLDDLAKISTTEPATSRLTVTRKKGVQIELVDMVKTLAAVLGAE